MRRRYHSTATDPGYRVRAATARADRTPNRQRPSSAARVRLEPARVSDVRRSQSVVGAEAREGPREHP